MKVPGLERASYDSSPHPVGQTELLLSNLLSDLLSLVWPMEKGREGLTACIGYYCSVYEKEK